MLDFWRCDARALYQCPNGPGRCGKTHVTPKPRDVLFDDLVRKTAAGLIVPLEYRSGSRMQRFWVPSDERDRYFDTFGAPRATGDVEQQRAGSGSKEGPTCRPRAVLTSPGHVLDWRDRSHWSGQDRPCRYCQTPTPLLDDMGSPAHKVCYEEALEGNC